MSERNDRMAAMLAADAPIMRDTAFEIAVMARIEQRQFCRAIARQLGLGALASLLLALGAPALNSAMGDVSLLLGQVTASNLTVGALLLAATAALLPGWFARAETL